MITNESFWIWQSRSLNFIWKLVDIHFFFLIRFVCRMQKKWLILLNGLNKFRKSFTRSICAVIGKILYHAQNCENIYNNSVWERFQFNFNKLQFFSSFIQFKSGKSAYIDAISLMILNKIQKSRKYAEIEWERERERKEKSLPG